MTTPAYPPAPMNTYPPAAPLSPPGTIRTAFFIYVLAALVAVAGAVLLITSSAFNDVIAANGDAVDASGVSVSQLVSTVRVISIVAAVIFVGLYLLFAFKMQAGRNWARIVLTVLTALSIANTLRPAAYSIQVNDVTYNVSATQAAGWIGDVLGVIAIVMMFMPASNAYVTAVKARRSTV